MRASEKQKSDIARWLDSSAAAEPAEFVAGNCVERFFGYLPEGLRASIAASLARRLVQDRAAAAAWLGALAGIFLQDYDDSALNHDDWKELSGFVSAAAGELDMDVLTYVMSLVMDHGAL